MNTDPRQTPDEPNDDFMTCVVCGMDYLSPEGMLTPRVRVGRDVEAGHDVLACSLCCGEPPKPPKPTGSSRLFWLGCLTAATVSLAGCTGATSANTGPASDESSSTSEAAAPNFAKVGDVVEYTINGANTARVVLNSVSWEQGRGLVGDFTFEVLEGAVPVNLLYFRVTRPDGTVIDPAFTSNGFTGADVAAGRNIRGQVEFPDVPPGETVLIDYTDPLGTALITWEVGN